MSTPTGYVPPLGRAHDVARQMHARAVAVDIHDHMAVVESLAALRAATGMLLDALDAETQPTPTPALAPAPAPAPTATEMPPECGARRPGWEHGPAVGRHRIPCVRMAGHDGSHRNALGQSWAAEGDNR